MKSLIIYFWQFFICRIPNNYIRRFYFSHVLNNNIDERTSLLRDIEITSVSGITIGVESTINKGVLLDGRGEIIIGSNVSISPDVKIITASHDINSPDFKLQLNPVIIQDYVWVCTAAIILPGVTLGTGAVVAAGSVVTKNVPPYTVVAGNPAKVVGVRNNELAYSPLWRPRFQ